MNKYQVTKEDIDKLNQKRAWAAFITAGAVFTEQVLYWMGLLPPHMFKALQDAMEIFKALPTK